MRERKEAADKSKGEMEGVAAELGATLERKKADLLTMQSRLHSAKSSFDAEVARKQREVRDLELAAVYSLSWSGRHTGRPTHRYTTSSRRWASCRATPRGWAGVPRHLPPPPSPPSHAGG